MNAARVGWWRRNRAALVGLPLVAALAVAASSSRVWEIWMPLDTRVAHPAAALAATTWADTYEDDAGPHDRSFGVTVLQVVEDPELSALGPETLAEELPDDARVWRVDVKYQVDPQTVLQPCGAALVADDGSRSDYDTGLVASFDAPSVVCEPLSRELSGPVAVDRGPLGDDTVDQEPSQRPGAYVVPLYFLLQEDKTPSELLLWWQLPDYLSVDLAPALKESTQAPAGDAEGSTATDAPEASSPAP